MSIFRFKKFSVRQDKTAMKVGTDGVLLGAWADISRASTILDVGTGTGLIALMAAQRNEHAEIHAVEINPEAASQARENIISSPWKERIRLFNLSIFDFHPGNQYDSIICNPPFFPQATQNPDKARNTARHCDDLFHKELLKTCLKLLHPDGNISLILPVEEAQTLIRSIEDLPLYPSQITEVYPTVKSTAPKRYLIEFLCTKTSCIKDYFFIEHSRHHYSETYRKLTQEFYL